MTKLNDIVNKMIIKDKVMCMGDIWHNEIITNTFKDVKSNKFNVKVATFVLDLILDKNGEILWYYHNLSKTQLKKLNAIMKAKTKETLQKRIYSFSDLITKGMYSHLLNKQVINKWIEFCNNNKLDHGLVKVNKAEQIEKQINNMLKTL